MDAQLLKTQNAVNDVKDQVASAIERLSDLMGRDVHTQFRVTSISGVNAELEILMATDGDEAKLSY